MLLGDFNATTGTEPDYCHGDADAHLMDLPYNYIEDIPLPRCNIDNGKIDRQGERLLDLCKSSGLRIANGRILGDTLGYPTCYSPVAKIPSLIDYCITSAPLLKDIRTLTVNNLSTHSIHCSLSVELSACKYRSQVGKPSELRRNLTKFTWNQGDDLRIQEVLSRSAFQEKLKKPVSVQLCTRARIYRLLCQRYNNSTHISC